MRVFAGWGDGFFAGIGVQLAAPVGCLLSCTTIVCV